MKKGLEDTSLTPAVLLSYDRQAPLQQMVFHQPWLLLLSSSDTDVDGTPNLYDAVDDENATFPA